MDPFPTSLDHIRAELERLDLLLRVQVWRVRQMQDVGGSLYIGEAEVDRLLTQPLGTPAWATQPLPPDLLEQVQGTLDQSARTIAQRKEASQRQGVELRLDKLATLFELTPLDLDLLLLCLAPELDSRYDRLYAYLHDDVTRRFLSIEVALQLLCPDWEGRVAALARLTLRAPLFHYVLLQRLEPDEGRTPLPRQGLRLDERIARYLLGSDEMDSSLLPYCQLLRPHTTLETLLLPEETRRHLAGLVQMAATGPTLLYLQGAAGVGKQTVAEGLAGALGGPLVVVHGAMVEQVSPNSLARLACLVEREARLQGAVLYWSGMERFLSEEWGGQRDVLLKRLSTRRGLTVLGGSLPWGPTESAAESTMMTVELAMPSHGERVRLWSEQVADSPGLDLAEVASRFRLSPGQIREAAATARTLARARTPDAPMLTMADLYMACRLHSNRQLEALATKIVPRYGWEEIVLPPARVGQLREMCSHMRHRALVHEQWGFGARLALGKGLYALFTGPPGTGKTMAADIIAGELGLDLYQIDLSTVVSKYIGETEKNLGRIFAEAETSNAILFFDEADALFGKRTQVQDAHDRHANVEVSYLLQRMESYQGIVILATNLRKNMDEAFMRRLHFIVEFPFPDEAERRRIWEAIWPTATPLSHDVELELLARRFELAGGHIRNIALAAAFLAAEGGAEAITLRHILHATQREHQKMGKILLASAFEG